MLHIGTNAERYPIELPLAANADRPADRCGGACREVDRPVPSLERTLTFNLSLYRWEPVHLGEARHQPAFGFARLHVDMKCLRLGHVAERALRATLGIAAVEREAERQTARRLHDAGRGGKAERRCLSCHRLGNVDLADREAVQCYAHRQARAADARARGG